jgi:hypothetical protein
VKLRDLIPSRTFDIGTSWSPNVAAIELKKAIDPARPPFGGSGDAPFTGEVRGAWAFEFSRRIGYRNSFLPMIRVVVKPSYRGGSRLHVRMQLHPLVGVFVALWMAGAVIGALVGLGVLLLRGEPLGLAVLALPLFGAAILGIPFALEAKKSESLLRSIYERAPAPLDPPSTGHVYRIAGDSTDEEVSAPDPCLSGEPLVEEQCTGNKDR